MNHQSKGRGSRDFRRLFLFASILVSCLFLSPSLSARAQSGVQNSYEAAYSLFQQGKYDEALSVLQLARGIFPGLTAKIQRLVGNCYQWKGDYDQAITEYKRLLGDHSSSEAAQEARFWIGTCLEAKNQNQEAVAEFLKQEQDFPSVRTAETLHKIATRYRGAGDVAKAEQYFVKLKNLTSSTDLAKAKRANLLVGVYLRESGRWSEAADHYATLKTKYPEASQDILYQLAEAQFASEKKTLAAKTYQEFVNRFPHHPQVGYCKLRIEEALRSLNQIDDALSYLRGLASEGGALEAEALIRQAEILGDYKHEGEAALNLLDQVATRFPNNKRILGLVEFNKGRLKLNRLARFSEARTHFQTMLERYPDKNLSIEAAINIADTYAQEENWDKARELYLKAFVDYDCPQKDWIAHCKFMAGDCLYRLKRTSEATLLWQEVIREFPTSDWKKQAERMLLKAGGN